jgi:hypothetical protein
MAKRAAVCVGVDRAGTLTPLQAAASGAQDFGTWAEDQGCDVTVLVDGPASKVTINDIFDAVNAVVDKATYDQLIVYFSGHGILLAPGAEYWLLSRAPGNPNEAVNLFRSIEDARNSGIPHVVFVSDACRSSVKGPPLSAVTGGLIFPVMAAPPRRGEVDVFYATRPGDPAYEVEEAVATQRFRGIFTSNLLSAVKSPPAGLVESAAVGGMQLPVITTRMLKPHLEEVVPVDAAAIDVKLRQAPEVQVGTALPKFFADASRLPPPPAPAAALPATIPAQPRLATDSRPRVGAAAATSAAAAESPPIATEGPAVAPAPIRLPPPVIATPSAPRPARAPAAAAPPVATKPASPRSPTLAAAFDALGDTHFRPVTTAAPMPAARTAADLGLGAEVDRLAAARGRGHFETRTGFTVYGDGVASVSCLAYAADAAFPEASLPGALHVRLNLKVGPERPCSAVIEFTSGTGTIVAVLPGFIGTVVVADGRVVSVSYVPSDQTGRFGEYQRRADELDRMRAFAAVASRNGSFAVESEGGAALGARIRQAKNIDPSLGLYAAYAYAQVGAYDEVFSVFNCAVEDPEVPVLFDIVMLAGRYQSRVWTDGTIRHAPFAPVLGQGWSLLLPGDPMHRPIHQRLRPYLVPSLWTTFDLAGVRIASEAVVRGEEV